MGLLKTAAKAYVATRVIGSTHRRQQERWAAQDAREAAPAPHSPGPAAPPTDPIIQQLTQLGELRSAGVLTDAEFEAQKQRILSAR